MGSSRIIVPRSVLWDRWPTPSRDPRVPWQSNAHLLKPRSGRGLESHLATTTHTDARLMIMSTFTLRIALLLLTTYISTTFTIFTTSIIIIMGSTGLNSHPQELATTTMNVPTYTRLLIRPATFRLTSITALIHPPHLPSHAAAPCPRRTDCRQTHLAVKRYQGMGNCAPLPTRMRRTTITTFITTPTIMPTTFFRLLSRLLLPVHLTTTMAPYSHAINISAFLRALIRLLRFVLLIIVVKMAPFLLFIASFAFSGSTFPAPLPQSVPFGLVFCFAPNPLTPIVLLIIATTSSV